MVSHEFDTQVVAQFLGDVQWCLRVCVLVTHRIRLDAQHELQALDTIQTSAHVQNVVAIVVASRQRLAENICRYSNCYDILKLNDKRLAKNIRK